MIKLFLTDLDGCLTDGTYMVFSGKDGIAKQFYSRDFHGLKLLSEQGVSIGVVTLASSSVIDQQISRICVPIDVYSKCEDKFKLVEDTFVKKGLVKWSEIAYIGDDVIDLELLSAVGLPACPADAHKTVIENILSAKDGIVTANGGGRGCVREIVDLILSQIKK